MPSPSQGLMSELVVEFLRGFCGLLTISSLTTKGRLGQMVDIPGSKALLTLLSILLSHWSISIYSQGRELMVQFGYTSLRQEILGTNITMLCPHQNKK